ncbi:MAG: response regulator [Spirochaetales bacterium]|nr:response regulator [Spirochaetales bacterium]
MMKKKLFPLFLFLLLTPAVLFLSCDSIPDTELKAVNGEMSLSLMELNKRVFPLDGEWEFYWGRHVSPDDFSAGTAPPPDFYITVPGSWQFRKIDGKPLPCYGIATFRMHLHLPEILNDYGFMFSSLAPAYNLYVNGSLQLTVGNPVEELDNAMEAHYTGVNFFTAASGIDLVLHVSNRSEKRTGLPRHIYFGKADRIAGFDSRNVLYESFFLGIIFIIGLYHLIYWLIMRRDMGVLFFSLLCMLVSLRIAIEGMHLLFRVLPGTSWETSMKLNFLTYFLMVPLFYSYFRQLYPQSFHIMISRVLWITTLVLCVPVLVSRLRYYDNLSLVNHVITGVVVVLIVRGIVAALRRHRPGALIQLISFTLFFLTALNDILYNENVIVSIFLTRYGLLLIILTQAYMIAREYSNAYNQMQKLLIEREGIQLELEEKVRERTKQLELSNEAKMAFLRNMSHEMRTPINGIIGFAEILPEVTNPEELPYYATLILDESDHLINLINQLLDLARIEAGKLELVSGIFNLRETIFSIEPAIKIQAENKGLKFSISVDPLLPVHMSGDRVRYRQVLFNLLGNALKFTDEGEINLLVRRDSEGEDTISVYTEVRDTGVGIPQDKQAGIFNLFEQADSSSKRRFGGTGLGTAIAKELVKMMNGDINFHSIEGAGSVFWFTVVFGKADNEYSPEEPAGDPASELQENRHKILLVEDYPTNQNILRRHLEKSGYTVWLANNGREGVELFGRQPFDLVIMDIQMPVMDGYEATERIRGTENGSTVPVIGLTASAFEEDRRKGLDVGMNIVLTKPVRRNQLLDTVNKLLAADR